MGVGTPYTPASEVCNPPECRSVWCAPGAQREGILYNDRSVVDRRLLIWRRADRQLLPSQPNQRFKSEAG